MVVSAEENLSPWSDESTIVNEPWLDPTTVASQSPWAADETLVPTSPPIPDNEQRALDLASAVGTPNTPTGTAMGAVGFALADYLSTERGKSWGADTWRQVKAVGNQIGAGALELMEDQPTYALAKLVVEATGVEAPPMWLIKDIDTFKRDARLLMMQEPELEDPTLTEQAFSTAVVSSTMAFPVLLAAYATRGKSLATGGIGFGVLETSRQYGEDLAMGIPKEVALPHAIRAGLLEGGTEMLPMGYLMRLFEGAGGKSVAKRLGAFLATEFGGEYVAEYGQLMNDWLTGLRDQPTKEEMVHLGKLVTYATAIGASAQMTAVGSLKWTHNKLDQQWQAYKGNKELRDIVDLGVKIDQELDAAYEQGDMPDLTMEQARDKLQPILHNLFLAAQSDPKVAKALGLDNPARIKALEKALSVDLQPLLDSPSLMETETDIVEGKVVLRDEDEVVRDLPEMVPVTEREQGYYPVGEDIEALAEQEPEATAAQLEAREQEPAESQIVKTKSGYAVFTDGAQIGTAKTRKEAQAMIERDEAGLPPAIEEEGYYPIEEEQTEIEKHTEEGHRISHLGLRRGSGVLEITGASVREEDRGKGLGQAQVKEAFEVAEQEGRTLQSSSTVLIDQLRVYEALRKKGWTITYGDPKAVAKALKEGGSVYTPTEPVVTEIRPPEGTPWREDSKNFSTPKTKAMQKFLDKEAGGRVTGLVIDDEGVFIHTDSSKWSDDAGAGTFRADSETAAIKMFKELVQKTPEGDAMDTLIGGEGIKSGEYLQFLRDEKRLQELSYRIALEAIPSPETAQGQFLSALSFDQQRAYTDRVNEIASIESIASALGIEVAASESTGGWMGGVAPINVVQVRTADEATKLAKALAYTRTQMSVPWFHVGGTVGAPGMFIEFDKALTLDQRTALSRELGTRVGGAGFTELADNRFAVMDFAGVTDFYEMVMQATEEIPGLATDENYFDLVEFISDENFYEEYDWTNDATPVEVLRSAGLTPAQESQLRGWRDEITPIANEFGYQEEALDARSNWVDFMPFASVYKFRRQNGATTLKISSDKVKADIAELLERVPDVFIRSAAQIGFMEGGRSGVAAQYIRGIRVVRIREDELYGDYGKMYITHEFGHSISFWEGGEHGIGLASQSPMYHLDLVGGTAKGAITSEAIRAWVRGRNLLTKIIGETGTKEWSKFESGHNSIDVTDTRRHMANNNWSATDRAYVEYVMEMSYPLTHLGIAISQNREIALNTGVAPSNDELKKKGIKSVEFFKEELFAQQFAMYHHMADILRIAAPQAYRIMEQINEAGNAGNSIEQTNAVLRGILRASGSGLRSEELPGLTRGAQNGLAAERGDIRIQGPRRGPGRNGRNLLSRAYQRLKQGEPLLPGGAALFERLGSSALFSWAKPMGNLPLTDQLLALRGLTQGQIAKVENLESHLYDIFHGLDTDVGYAVHQYMTTAGAKAEDFIDPTLMVRDKQAEKRRRVKESRGVFSHVAHKATDKKIYTPLFKKATATKRMILGIGKELVKMGVLDQEVFEANEDAYLPRVYLKYMLGEEGVQHLANHGRIDASYLKQRKDLTQWEKEVLLGQVYDPALVVPMAIGRTLRDKALWQYMQAIGKEKEWVSPATLVEWEIPGEFWTDNDAEVLAGDKTTGDPKTMHVTGQWLAVEGNRLLNLVEKYPAKMQGTVRFTAQAMLKHSKLVMQESNADFNSKDWMMLPDTPAYGTLRGAWVRKEIGWDLQGAMKVEINDAGKLENWVGFKTLSHVQSAWKLNKVALNPPTVARNVQSNLIMMNVFAGMPLFRPSKYNALKMFFSDSITEIVGNGKYYRAAQKHGVSKSSFADAEMIKIRKGFEAHMDNKTFTGASFLKIGHEMARKIAELGGDSYQGIEIMGKVAIIKYAMEAKNMSEAEAVALAQDTLFDYSLVPKWVEFLRKYPIGFPFLTFQYKVVPKLVQTLFENPHRFLPWIALVNAIYLAAVSFGDFEDDEELEEAMARLPSYLRDNPGMLPFPFKDDEGNIRFFDISYIFPWSMPLSVAGHLREGDIGGAYGELGHGGPILSIAEGLGANEHPFYETDLWLEGDSGSVKFAKGMEFVWNTMAPGILTTEKSNPPIKWLEAKQGRPDLYGNPAPTQGDAFARLFGWNLYRIDPDRALAKNLSFYKAGMDEFYRKQMSLIRGESDPKRRAEMLDYTKRRMLSMGKGIAEYRLESGEINKAEYEQMILKLDQQINAIGDE